MLFFALVFFVFMYPGSDSHSGNKSDDRSMVYAPRKDARTDGEAGTIGSVKRGATVNLSVPGVARAPGPHHS
jgi:hypothetical protein